MASGSNSPSTGTETVATVIEVQTTSEYVATRSSTVYGVSSYVTTIDGAVLETVTSIPTGIELVLYSTTEVLNVSVTSQIVVTSTVDITPTTSMTSAEEVSPRPPAFRLVINSHRRQRAQPSHRQTRHCRLHSQQSCPQTRMLRQAPTSTDSPPVPVYQEKRRSV
jgi:hypothetical protein